MATIHKRPSGRWRAQIRKADNTSLSKSFGTKSEAKKWAGWAEGEVERHRRVDTGKTRFGDLIDAYTKAHRAMGRSKTAGIALIRRRLGTRRLVDMARGQSYLDFVQQREQDGAGPATILQDLSYVHTVLVGGGTLRDADVAQALAALGGVRRMLAAQGRVARPVERSRRPTDNELMTLFQHWQANKRQTIPMEDLALFAVATAMRLGEIVGLRWEDLDTEARTIVIRDRKHPRAKRGNDQEVPLLRGPFKLNGQIVDPLAIIQRQPTKDQRGRIFPYVADSISTAFTRAVAAKKVADLHFHDLRHDGCSRLFEAGYTIEQVSLVSGHRDWNMLRRYTQLRAGDLHRDLAGEGEKVVPLRRASETV